MKLDKFDIALTNGCAKEDSRPVLTNLCLRNGKLAAADGFMLVVRDADLAEGENPPETMLPAKILKTIKPGHSVKVGRVNRKVSAELTINGRCEVSYKTETGEPVEYETSMSFKPSNPGTFPNYNQLFPKGQEKTAVTAVSVRLLKQLVKCLPDDGIVRLGIVNPTSPLEFHCTDTFSERPIYGMLMPMYVDWSTFRWPRDEENQEKVKED
jgi:hypothetical protein